MLYPRLEFSVTTSSGLSHKTKFAASSSGIPGRTPTTSSTGAPEGRSADAFAGQLTLPRISLATCSALAGPEDEGLGDWPTTMPRSFLPLHPAASAITANAYTAHNRPVITPPLVKTLYLKRCPAHSQANDEIARWPLHSHCIEPPHFEPLRKENHTDGLQIRVIIKLPARQGTSSLQHRQNRVPPARRRRSPCRWKPPSPFRLEPAAACLRTGRLPSHPLHCEGCFAPSGRRSP